MEKSYYNDRMSLSIEWYKNAKKKTKKVQRITRGSIGRLKQIPLLNGKL